MDTDIRENDIIAKYQGILEILLLDRTTGENIFWATDSYSEKGVGYQNSDKITVDRITGDNGTVIRPRAKKSSQEQAERAKDKAEVFTPSWICNKQNNLIDDAWFGSKESFNTEVDDEAGNHYWTPTNHVDFSITKYTWKDYVRDVRMEITCGEAPYLASRYDTTTGEYIPVKNRIGLLDRKLRVVSENAADHEEWLQFAKRAYQSIYGFEWQGDNLILARESLFITFIEFHEERWGDGFSINLRTLKGIAEIISWNIWQMDGIKCVIPDSCHDDVEHTESLFGDSEDVIHPCPGCTTGDHARHNGIYPLVRDWVVYEDYHTDKFGRKGCERSDIPFIDYVLHKNRI